MDKTKGTLFERILDELIVIAWAIMPALGGMGIMQIARAPIWASIGVAIILFPIFGIFDRINEINNRLKENGKRDTNGCRD